MKRMRRVGALERLENQLTTKTKTKKKSFEKVGLTEKDLKRIKKEIEVLKKRVV
jgi:5-bromo-4-chloroindolyl phosphate hydrolysis protein